MWGDTYTCDELSYIYRHVLNGFKESLFRDLGVILISGSGCHLEVRGGRTEFDEAA